MNQVVKLFCQLPTHRFSNPTNRLWIRERPQNVTGGLGCQILKPNMLKRITSDKTFIYDFYHKPISFSNQLKTLILKSYWINVQINVKQCQTYLLIQILISTVNYRPFLPFPRPPLWTVCVSVPTSSLISASSASQARDSVFKKRENKQNKTTINCIFMWCCLERRRDWVLLVKLTKLNRKSTCMLMMRFRSPLVKAWPASNVCSLWIKRFNSERSKWQRFSSGRQHEKIFVLLSFCD